MDRLPSVLLWAAIGGLSAVAARVVTGRKVAGTDRLPLASSWRSACG